MKRRSLRSAALLAICAVLTACGQKATSPLPKAPAVPGKTTPVKFVVLVPGSKSTAGSSRKPRYISAGTKSIKINAQEYNVTPASPNCAAISAGTQCTFTVDAGIGYATFTISAYDQPLDPSGHVQGNMLSTGSTTATIVEGTNNDIHVTLGGVPSTATLTISNATPPIGTPADIPMTLTVKDADGYTIVGPFSPALQVASNSSFLGFTVNGISGSAIGSSSDIPGLLYSGHNVGPTTITVSAQNDYSGRYYATANFTPQPGYGSELPVGTSLVNASAWRDSSYERRTWFTEPAKHMYATYPQNGAIVEYPVASGHSLLRITSNVMMLAFTENVDSVATAYPDVNQPFTGSVFEKPLTSTNTGVYQIGGFDSNNSIWFTEKAAGKIGKVDTSGNQTEYATGNAHSTPAGMAWCDGASWFFADPGANAIGRVTLAGGVTYYPVPTSAAQPTEITTSDSNGHWWFTEPGAKKIGSVDINGNVHEYASPGTPVSIVAEQVGIFVLNSAGAIEGYDINGTLQGTYAAPASSNGPPVSIYDAGNGNDLMVLRSDGTHGSIQTFSYE